MLPDLAADAVILTFTSGVLSFH